MRTPISKIERIAGVFILAALVALAALVFFPGLLSGRYLVMYKIAFRADDGIGLAAGDKIVLQGVQVGEVTDGEFDDSGKVLIRGKIYPEHRKKLTAGTQALLVPPALMGSPIVKLLPGQGPPLPGGSVLDAPAQRSPFENLGGMGDLMGQTFERINVRLEQTGGILAQVREILQQVSSGEGTAGKILKDDELYRRVLDMSASAQRSLIQVEKGLESFPELSAGARVILADSRRIIESLKRNFIIRATLPAEREPSGMLPASYREPAPGRK